MFPVIHVVGNRPQFIKLAVLHKALAHLGIEQKIVHSGQHYDYEMSKLFFEQLHIPEPDKNFHIRDKSANAFIASFSDLFQEYLSKKRNASVIVYGDTNTTLGAAIAAKRTSNRLIHFEAGVRTDEMDMPEEINRLLTDRLADVNYCCTALNFQTMQQEGYGNAIPCSLLHSGDLMLDAFMAFEPHNENNIPFSQYVACTIHRAANIGSQQNLSGIVDALNEIHKTIPVVVPLHPHTQKRMEEFSIKASFKILPPQGYTQMKSLLQHASYIITDSGGTAREAYFVEKPSMVIMPKPFWPEIINAGCALNTDATKENILKQFSMLAKIKGDFSGKLFGNGDAAQKIAAHLQTLS